MDRSAKERNLTDIHLNPSSLIVCAKQLADLAGLQGTIDRNLPRVFDVIPILEADTIASGYNLGARLESAIGWVGHHEVLAFTHCDTEFLFPPSAWEDCLELLSDTSVGFVGVCGSKKLEYDGQQWPPSGFGSGGVMHRQNDLRWYSSFGVFGQTLALDGLFLACRREVFEKLGGFDEEYPGWHYYDVDITLRSYLAGYTNHTFPLLISHGVANFQATKIEEWKKDRAVFLDKFGAQMPMILEAKKEAVFAG